MSNITSKIKTTWLKCMETIGQSAANMADNAKQKLGELNMENRRKDLVSELPEKLMKLWKDGAQLPEELTGMLTELNGINEELDALRAARLAKKQKPAITDGTDAVKAEEAVQETAEEVTEEAAEVVEEAAEAVEETAEEAVEEAAEEAAEAAAQVEEAVAQPAEEQNNY
jgi:hypothetical protein